MKMQHLKLINAFPCCVDKWIRVNTCNCNENSITDYSLRNSELASMISKVIIDTRQDYKLKGRKYSNHNTFIIDINTKTKHLEIVGKSVWKLNEKTDWKNYKKILQNKIQIYDWNTKNSTGYTEKILIVLHEAATKSTGKYKISNNILNNKQIQETKKLKRIAKHE